MKRNKNGEVMAVRRIMYIIFLLASVWIFIVFIDYSALQLLISLVVIPIILDIITFIASRNVTVNLELKDIYVVKKKTVQLVVKVANPSVLPFIGGIVQIEMRNGFSKETVNKKLKINVSDKEINKYFLDVLPEYCGRIDISVKKFKLYDFTGIWSFKGKIGKAVQLYVLPQSGNVNVSVSDRNNEYIDEPMKFSENEPGDDCSQVFDLREFRDGDKVQRIHWKLSAKRDEMYVKEFSMPIDASAEILLELSLATRENLLKYTDTIIETAYGLSVAFLDQEIYHYISWYDNGTGEIIRREITNEADIWNTLNELYHATLYSESMAIKVYESEGTNRNSYLFYITADEKAVVTYMPHKLFLVGGNSSNENIVGVELGKAYESIEYLGEV